MRPIGPLLEQKGASMICRNKIAGRMGCMAPLACGTFGYCRQRNIDAGGMSNVTPEQQEEWKRLDNPPKPDS